MNQLWRYLFRENPMQIETTRALRRFTVSGGYTPQTQKAITWSLMGILYVLYAWFLVTILYFREDMSQGLLWFELGLLTLFVPGSLYASISGERERLTWDSLILTNLSPARILVGKLLWRLTLAGIILLAFLPPLLLTHFTAHYQQTYSLSNLFLAEGGIAAWCLFLATFTVWVSSRTKRSVATLSIVTLFLIASLFLIPTVFFMFGGDLRNAPSSNWSTQWNPNYPMAWNGDANSNQGVPKYDSLYEVSPLSTLGSIIFHLNPAMMIASMTNDGLSAVNIDFWRDFLAMTPNQRGVGIYTLAPFIYLIGAGCCVGGTLRALARLGLPARSRKGQG